MFVRLSDLIYAFFLVYLHLLFNKKNDFYKFEMISSHELLILFSKTHNSSMTNMIFFKEVSKLYMH